MTSSAKFVRRNPCKKILGGPLFEIREFAGDGLFTAQNVSRGESGAQLGESTSHLDARVLYAIYSIHVAQHARPR